MSNEPTRPEIDFPGDEPPTELVIEDITVGYESLARRHGAATRCPPRTNRKDSDLQKLKLLF